MGILKNINCSEFSPMMLSEMVSNIDHLYIRTTNVLKSIHMETMDDCSGSFNDLIMHPNVTPKRFLKDFFDMRNNFIHMENGDLTRYIKKYKDDITFVTDGVENYINKYEAKFVDYDKTINQLFGED